MEFSHRGTDVTPSWERWERENVAISGDRVRIARNPFPAYRSVETVVEGDDGPSRFVDLAVDDCGEVFLLGADGAVYRHSPGEGCDRLLRIDCLVGATDEPRAIGVTRDSLYVASGNPGRVQAFSRHAGGMRWSLTEGIDDPVTFVRIDGAICLLDRGNRPGRGTVRRLTADARVVPIVTGLYEPIDIDVDDDGALYVLEPHAWTDTDDPDRYVVRRLPAQAVANPPTTGVDTVWIPPEGFRTLGSGDPLVPACLASGVAGELVVGTARRTVGEDAVFGFRPNRAGFAHQTDVPAGCAVLALDRSGSSARLYVIDGDGSLLVSTAETERRRNPTTDAYDGRIRTRLDAGVTGTQWHRIRLARELTDQNTELTVRYHATDEPAPDRLSLDPDALPSGLTGVAGIGPRKSWRLRRAGVSTLVDLAASDPETIAAIVSVEEIDVPVDRVREWQSAAESILAGGDDALRSVDGIGPVFAARLRAAGIESLEDLIGEEPKAVSVLLGSRLRTVSTVRTANWIADADALLPETPGPETFVWETTPPNPEEALLSNAVGRYLWVEVELVGTAVETPAVHATDVSYPRRSYLEELPAVYRSDGATSEFLEPFLALFESVLTGVGESISDLPRYLDPETIPAEAEHLEWLGGWLAAELDAGWPDAAKRAFIANAPALYRMRGTRRGLQMAVDTYLDHVDVDREAWDRLRAIGDDDAEVALVRVFEHADLACAADTDAWESYSRLISCPQGFLVLLHPALEERHVTAIGRIVGHQRPAHTSGRAVALRPVTVLTGHDRGERGFHSYLGINTALSAREFTVESSTLGQETVLHEREPHGTVGIRSRLGEDVRLS